MVQGANMVTDSAQLGKAKNAKIVRWCHCPSAQNYMFRLHQASEISEIITQSASLVVNK